MESVKVEKDLKSQRHDERPIGPGEPNLWTHLHALSRHWLSDLEFYEDELAFFRILIDKHLELFIDAKNIVQTRTMVAHVQNLEKRRVTSEQKIRKHLTHIAALTENPFVQNAQTFKNEHEALETEFLDFVKQYRNVKREVFKLTEQIVRTGAATKLIEKG